MVLNRGRSPSIHKGQLNSPMLLPRSFFGFGVAVSSQPIGHDVDVLDDEWIPQHGDHSALDDGFRSIFEEQFPKLACLIAARFSSSSDIPGSSGEISVDTPVLAANSSSTTWAICASRMGDIRQGR